jgi:hypothetical protein
MLPQQKLIDFVNMLNRETQDRNLAWSQVQVGDSPVYEAEYKGQRLRIRKEIQESGLSSRDPFGTGDAFKALGLARPSGLGVPTRIQVQLTALELLDGQGKVVDRVPQVQGLSDLFETVAAESNTILENYVSRVMSP